MATFAEIKARASRPETSVSLCLAGSVLARYRDLEQRLERASTVAPSLGERSEASLLAEQLRDLEAEMSDASHTFVLRAMHPREWADFRLTVPERGEDEDAFKTAYFAWLAELVSRCCIDPVMTSAEVTELVDDLSGSQWDKLANETWALNADEVTIPFSAAASALIGSDETRSRQPSPSDEAPPAGSAKSRRKPPPTNTTTPGD
jgi:hypothetical protein